MPQHHGGRIYQCRSREKVGAWGGMLEASKVTLQALEPGRPGLQRLDLHGKLVQELCSASVIKRSAGECLLPMPS